MAPQKSLIIILSICLLSLSASATSTPKLAAEICKGFNNKDLCMKTLSSPAALSAKDLTQLTSAVMKTAQSNAQATLNLISDLAKKPCPPANLKALQECEKVFRMAVNSFDIVSREVSEDAQTANYDVHLLAPAANDCINAMKAANLQAPQIETANLDLQLFSNMGFEMTSKMD